MFTDFVTYTTNSAAIVSVTFGRPRVYTDLAHSPLVGTASLQFHHISPNIKSQIQASAPLPIGIKWGSLQTTWEDLTVDATISSYAFGLYCLAGGSNLLGANNCYMAGLERVGATFRMWIGKSVVGITQNVSVLLSTVSTGAWVNGIQFTQKFSWKISGTTIELKTQTWNVGSTISGTLSVVDTSGAFTTYTSGEGFFAHNNCAAITLIFADTTIIGKIS